jgi:hypothetical protein
MRESVLAGETAMAEILRPLAMVALAVGPVAAAHGTTSLPSFDCTSAISGDGGTVSWLGDGLKTTTTPLVFDSKTGSGSNLDCFDDVTGDIFRKSGEGQKDFLKVTLKEILISSVAPTVTYKFNPVPTVLQTGQVVYRNLWDVTLDYYSPEALTPFARNFIGLEVFSTVKLSDATLMVSEGAFNFTSSLWNRVALFATPQTSVPEPGTFGLLGTGLLGLGAAARRRRSW